MNKVEIRYEELSYNSSEAYKALRTNLKFSGEDKKVVAITSCMENEGKSSIAMNLGISLAESGEKVIVLDADLRKSVLVGRTRVMEDVLGLTHYLSGQANMSDVINETNIENFSIVYAGPTPPNPAELLGGKRFHELVESLRASYDYVIVDTPPLGMVIDTAIVAKELDGVMIVVESGNDSYKFVRSIKDQLEKAQVSILGVVLNKVDISKAGYYGRYGKYGAYGAYGAYGNRSNNE